MRALLAATYAASLALFAIVATDARADQFLSMTMAGGCNIPQSTEEKRRIDEDWITRIKEFLPPRDYDNQEEMKKVALRTLTPEQGAESLVLQAKYQQSRVCADYRAGKIPQKDADLALSGFELTIRLYLKDKANAAHVKAASGQISQLEAIDQALVPVASTGRQAGLMGLKEIEEEAHQALINTFFDFDNGFSEKCMDQEFNAYKVWSLQQQEAALGSKNDIERCANRLAKIDYVDARNGWSLKHCGRGYGNWQFEGNGKLVAGSGTGQTDMRGDGKYSIHFSRFASFPADAEEKGTMKFYCTPDGACKCLMSPALKECKEKYGDTAPATQWLIDFGLTSLSGVIKLKQRDFPFPYFTGGKGIFAHDKATPVEYKVFDKPCDPDKVYH